MSVAVSDRSGVYVYVGMCPWENENCSALLVGSGFLSLKSIQAVKGLFVHFLLGGLLGRDL